MLFVIDDLIFGAVANGTCTVEMCEALELLGLALFEGKHRVTASQTGLQQFSRYAALSRKARSGFNEALNDYQADNALFRSLTVYAHITTAVSSITVTELAGVRRIDIPPSWIDDSAKVQATCLVGEFLTDCDFLQRVGALARAAGLANCVLRFESVNGGGSTCAPTLENLVESQRFCCCVVDSDKEHPADQFGETASAVQKFKNPTLYPFVGVTETAGRELENMIHHKFVERQYSTDINHRRTVMILKHADDTHDFDFKLYYDIKKGLVLADVHKHEAGGPQRVFWESKLLVLGALFNERHTHFECTMMNTCVADGCYCRLSNGFGTKVLRAFVADFDRLGENSVAAEIHPPLLDEWKRIGKFLFDWGCARDRVRA